MPMNIRRFDPATAPPAHNRTILAGPVLPEGMSAPFRSSWGYLTDGGQMEAHSHPDMEIYVVFRGEGTVRVGAEEEPVTCGDVIEIPPDVEHTMTCAAEGELLWAALWWPANATSRSD